MKNKKIFLYVFAVLFIAFIAYQLVGYGKAEDKKTDVQQKISTPPLQLTQEEETRTTPTPQTQPPANTGTMAPSAAPTSSMTPIKNKTKYEIILDASGSMNGPMGTTTKMDILKLVVSDVISQPMPDGEERDIGLRVYGSQKTSDLNDCKDSLSLLPVARIDARSFTSKIEGIKAQGVTPIGYALEQASGDFTASTNVDNVIILIADGSDSCNANLCEQAKALHSDAKKLIVHVIGFDIDQKSQTSLECLAKNSDGQFIIARNENELRAALDKILMANIPYNLRVKVLSEATPLSSKITVLKSGTKNIIREDETQGVKYYQLQPGTYDLEVTYLGSSEMPQPTKIVKGVEVQASSKAEQIVQFDLGILTLTAFDQDGTPIAASYTIQKKEEPNLKIKIEATAGPYTAQLTEGTYDIQVEATATNGLKFSGKAEGTRITKGGSETQDFKFQVGKIAIKGVDSKGEALAMAYKVTAVGDEKTIILEGKAPKEGATIDLPPGKYDLFGMLDIEAFKNILATKMEEIELVGGDTKAATIQLPVSLMTLSGKNSEGKIVATQFSIRQRGVEEKQIELTSSTEPISVLLPPGEYNVRASFLNSDVSPTPVISWENVVLGKDQVLTKEAVFKFGTIKLFGHNVKGAPMNTAFYIYAAGSSEPLSSLVGILSPTDVKLTEGFYDIKAEDLSSQSDTKSNQWFHSVEVKQNLPSSIEVMFVNGRLKILCNGPNNKIIECDYKIFSYGTDRPIIEGTTGQSWKEFDIPPGNYYSETGFHDKSEEAYVKKYETFSVKENEIVEHNIKY